MQLSVRGALNVDTDVRLFLGRFMGTGRKVGILIRQRYAQMSSTCLTGMKADKRLTTDIYGSFYLPSNLDLKGKYPILDSAYPGLQTTGLQDSIRQALPTRQYPNWVVQIDGSAWSWTGSPPVRWG